MGLSNYCRVLNDFLIWDKNYKENLKVLIMTLIIEVIVWKKTLFCENSIGYIFKPDMFLKNNRLFGKLELLLMKFGSLLK